MNVPLQRRSSAHSGFTLLELLISITLLGLILVLLFGGLRLGVRSWDAVQRQVDNLNSVRSIEGFLRTQMEKAYPYTWKAIPTAQLAFLGERNKVQFVSEMPQRIGSGGLFAVSLEIEQTNAGRRLLWRYIPVSAEMKDFSTLEQAKEMVLAGAELSAIDEIGLSYLGRENPASEPAWSDRWDSKVTLPLLIRIHVRLADGTDWPDFVVAPQLTSGVPR